MDGTKIERCEYTMETFSCGGCQNNVRLYRDDNVLRYDGKHWHPDCLALHLEKENAALRSIADPLVSLIARSHFVTIRQHGAMCIITYGKPAGSDAVQSVTVTRDTLADALEVAAR